jgi:competence protein CoiA
MKGYTIGLITINAIATIGGNRKTEWHRLWKNKFPLHFQEYFHTDQVTGEKHVADIRSPENIVIEFQHSSISVKERTSREQFYPNLIWLVDGTRLNRDLPRFLKGRSEFRQLKIGIFETEFPEDSFHKGWLSSAVPVLFDFLGTSDLIRNEKFQNYLYCIFPTRLGNKSVVAEIPRNTFVTSVVNGQWVTKTNNFLKELIAENQRRLQLDQELEKQRLNSIVNQFLNPSSARPIRRF